MMSWVLIPSSDFNISLEIFNVDICDWSRYTVRWSYSLFIWNSHWIFYLDHVERKVPKYEYYKIRERKVKTLIGNWRDHWRTSTWKLYRDISTGTAVFINWKSLDKDCRNCRNISIQFSCACPWVISSISGKSFHFPFPYFECLICLFIYILYIPRYFFLITWICQTYHFLNDLPHIKLLNYNFLTTDFTNLLGEISYVS